MMKWILKKLSCQSECRFNPQRDCPSEMFTVPWNLDDFNLKDKDLRALHRIFTKRKKLCCGGKIVKCETIV